MTPAENREPETPGTSAASAPQPAPKPCPVAGDCRQPDVSLENARKLLNRSRLLGRLSAVIFIIAALAVVDALQTLVRHEFNSIELVSGESVLVSGMMPADAKTADDLEITIEGQPGISFIPLETYKGFWMGGHMWRAELTADSGTLPGKTVIVVKDIIPLSDAGREEQTFDDRDRSILFGGQQNPALVFGVTVWASEGDRRANDTSLFRRFTGLPAFGVAVACVILALLAGIGNWRVFSRAEEALAAHDVFFIHGLKEVTDQAGRPGMSGYKAAFVRAGRPLAHGEEMILLDRSWQERSRGRIVETDKLKAHALFPADRTRPQYGWLVTRSGQGA